MKTLRNTLTESLISNIGIGPHIANEEFFKKLAKKRKADKTDYFKRFVRYIGIDEDKALKILRDGQRRKLMNTGTHKEIITKDWFKWKWMSGLKWFLIEYQYNSKGGYQDEYYNNIGEDLIRFEFDDQSLYINDRLQKQFDKLDKIFKSHQIYYTGKSTYRVYYIKDSIKDLTNI